MAATGSSRGSTSRWLAALGAAALLLALVPAPAAAHEEPACPDELEPAPFTDREQIPAVHRANVDCVAAHGIVAGFPDGTYRPAAGVRRDQLATFLFRTLERAGAELPEPDTDRFNDVPEGSAHDEAIHRLKAAGVAQGAGGGAGFAPATLIRRDQLVSFMARGIEHAAPGTIELNQQTATRFDDVPAGNVHSGNIEQTADLGVVQGFTEQTFGPSAGTRRDQLATFMVRLLGVLADDGHGPATTLGLALSRTTAQVGQDVTATATVEHDGTPVEGAAVNFTATGGQPVPETATVPTGATGTASFGFTSTETGTVTVTALVTHEGQSRAQQAQVTFTEPGPAGPEDRFTLTVDPESVEAGGTVTATARITTAGGAPVSNRPVQFTLTGAATEPRSGSVATVAGDAVFTFTAQAPGTVTVSARALLNPFHEHITRTATVTVN